MHRTFALGLLALTLSTHLPSVQAATVACNAQVTGCNFANDGAFPAQGQEWRTETAWWEGIEGAVTLDLGGKVLLQGLEVSLDNNDSYRIEVSLDGNTWTDLASIAAAQGAVSWGMDRFSSSPASSYFTGALTFGATEAAYLRVSATGGDNLYSVGEVALNTSPVPEASTVALLACGLAAIGASSLISRRRPHRA